MTTPAPEDWKNKIYWKLTYLRDWLIWPLYVPIDWLRYEVFYPEDDFF